MATYYVATDGDDGDPGSEAEPWATIQHAADTATAGDTVIFEDGTYTCNGVDFDTNSGSSGNVITFQARKRRLAIWERDTTGNTINLSVDYITFDQLAIKGCLTEEGSGSIIRMQNADNIRFDDCDICNTTGRGIWATSCATITFIDCDVHNETTYPEENPLDGWQIDGSGTANWTISGCTVYHTQHNGVAMYAADTAVIYNNTFYETGSHAISVGDPDGNLQCYDVLVEKNIVHHSGQWGSDSMTDPKRGIYVQWTAESVTIIQNVVYKCNGPGIAVRSNCYGPINIYNNTLYKNDKVEEGWGSVFLDEFGEENAPIIRFKNNLIVHDETTRTYLWEDAACTNVDADYNLLYDTTATEDIHRDANYDTYADYQTAGYEPNSVVSQDPKLSDPENGDFTLQATSPAIDAGVNVGLAYHGSKPDIGAFEYQNIGVDTVVHITTVQTVATETAETVAVHAVAWAVLTPTITLTEAVRSIALVVAVVMDD